MLFRYKTSFAIKRKEEQCLNLKIYLTILVKLNNEIKKIKDILLEFIKQQKILKNVRKNSDIEKPINGHWEVQGNIFFSSKR